MSKTPMTRAADHAVRVVVHLACLPDGSRASLADLAGQIAVPTAFLSKILQRLVRSGLIVSHRGRHGGFEVTRDLASVSLLDVLRALDSVPALNQCVAPAGCPRSATCGAHAIWLEAQDRLHDVLAGASLARIATIARTRERLASRRKCATRSVSRPRPPRLRG